MSVVWRLSGVCCGDVCGLGRFLLFRRRTTVVYAECCLDSPLPSSSVVPAVIGTSSRSGGDIAAASKLRKKAVFCIHNVNSSSTANLFSLQYGVEVTAAQLTGSFISCSEFTSAACAMKFPSVGIHRRQFHRVNIVYQLNLRLG